MPFIQTNKTNICKCDGCPERCELGATSNHSYNPNERYKPAINGKTIERFLSQNGTLEHITNWTSYTAAIEQARAISRLCDNYTLPHLTTPTKQPKFNKISVATTLISKITDNIQRDKPQDIKIMALLYLLWLEYQTTQSKYTKIPTNSPISCFEWKAWEFGPCDSEIYQNLSFIRSQIQNKKTPTLEESGFLHTEQDTLSIAIQNTYNYCQNISIDNLVMFNKYNLGEWGQTKMFKRMFTNPPTANANECDLYLKNRPLLLARTKQK